MQMTRAMGACMALLTLLLAVVANPTAAAASVAADSASAASPALYTFEGSLRLPRGPSSFVGARVLVNGGSREVLVHSDGSFRLSGLSAAHSPYTLDVALPDWSFPTLRLDISNKAGAKGKMTVSVAANKAKVSQPLVWRPAQRVNYFQQREPVNIMGWFKNPMAIMMVITLVMVSNAQKHALEREWHTDE